MLYKVWEAWPNHHLAGGNSQAFVSLAPGLYEYPFSFKVRIILSSPLQATENLILADTLQ